MTSIIFPSTRLQRILWKKCCIRNTLLHKSAHRTIVSDSYQCPDAWSARLSCPLLANVNAGEHLIRVQEQFDKEGSVSPIDIDILANRLEDVDPNQMDFAQALFQRFRHTQSYLECLESTPYAVVRGMLDAGELPRLMEMIKDKIEYGLFLEPHSANLLLDHCLEANEWQYAADVAFDQMLQEDFSHPITKALSWYACHMYWKNLAGSATQNVEEDEEDEMKYIPVSYIINPYYDDHFDIPKDSMRLGKTFVMLGQGQNDLVGNSYTLLGWAFYEKFDKGLDFLEQIVNEGNESSLSNEALETFKDLLDEVQPQEVPEEKTPGEMTLKDLYPYITEDQKQGYVERLEVLLNKIEGTPVITLQPLEPLITKYMEDTVSEHQNNDIHNQLDLYQKWQTDRQKKLDEEVKELQIKAKKKEIVQKLLDIQARDEKLRYFEQIDKVHLGISQRPKQAPIEDVEEEELFVAAPGERGRGKG